MAGRIREYTLQVCPICGHRGWCGRRDDGLVLCKRPPTPRELPGFVFKGMARDGVTGMYVEAGRELQAGSSRGLERQGSQQPLAGIPAQADQQAGGCQRISAAQLAEQQGRFVAQLDDEHRSMLAQALGLPLRALDALEIGWWPERRWWNPQDRRYEGSPGCWTFPERDSQGRVIGLALRWPDGQKGQLTGGRRGLILPRDWRERPDSVVIVEGASDVLAGRLVGLNVIGRPSNNGGSELLAHVCRHRRVIVLGENDRKADGRWPGREGARQVARRLSDAWGWPVPVALPPQPYKDLREWTRAELEALGHAPNDARLSGIGSRILEVIRPPELLLLAEPRARRNGRVTVKVFRWSGLPDSGLLYGDRLDLDSAAARRRFAKAVAAIVPDLDVSDLSDRLLGLPVPEAAHRPRGGGPPSQATATATAEAGVPGHRRQIQGNHRQLRDIRRDALAALKAANDPPRLFARAGGIARVRTVQTDHGDAIAQIQQLDADALRGELADAADWFVLRRSKHGDYLVPDAPPVLVARDILSLPEIDLPPLVAIVTCPTYAADGRLVVQEGYDQASGLWHHRTLSELPTVREQPTADDVVAAREMLLDVLTDFPFVDQASRANAVALMLLPFVRPMIAGPTPLHAVDAPTPGTGKGLLIQTCLWPALGGSVEIRSGARDADEWRKRITAELLAGKPVVGFDNTTWRLDSEHLAAVLTATLWTDRLLGQTRVVTIPNRAVWVCTGNNLSFSKELARRVVWIRLDARVEAPEQRTGFRYPDLLAHVREHRSELVGAALTLVSAWLAARSPKGRQVMGSFEDYAEALGGILEVAGIEGFLANADELRRQADSETREWRAFVRAWWERFEDAWVGVRDLAELLWTEAGERSELLPTVVRSDKPRGILTQLGMRLAKKRDGIIAGYRLVVGDRTDHKDRLAYRLVPTSQADSEGRHEVGGKVGNCKPRDERSLQPNADLGRPSGHTPLYARENNTRTCKEKASCFSPTRTRRNPKRSAKVGVEAQPAEPHEVASADLGADLPPTLALASERSASDGPAVRWYTGGEASIPPNIAELASPREGWTARAWYERLCYLAEQCKRVNPPRSAELRRAAAVMMQPARHKP